MIMTNRWRKAVGTFSLMALLVIAAGCAKQRTSLAVNKVDKLVQQAQGFNVDTHTEAKNYKDRALDLRRQADQQSAAGNYKQAVTLARDAVAQARSALEVAKEMEAAQQKGNADREVLIMNANNGAREDQQLYQEILDLQTKMNEKYSKQKWVATVELSKEIQQGVERLLMRLRKQANDDLIAVQAEYKRLIDEGGEEHASQFVERVNDQIQQIQQNIAPPTKNYLNAIAIARQAMIDAKEGIVETKKRKCEIAIEAIQGKMITAKQLKAEFFAPELWQGCSDDFAKLIDWYWRKEYDFVLRAAGRLEDQVDDMIYQTRLASATYQRDNLSKRITDLRNKKVETYLPGRLAPVEKALQEANALLTQEKFDEVERVCKDAQGEADAIMKAFRTLALGEIRKGRGLYSTAATVFKNMTRIFQQVQLEYEKPIDQKMEDGKAAKEKELGERLNTAQANLNLADVRLTGEEYAEAIELSREVQDEATDVMATIYNVVSHNVISEIADSISLIAREGAPEYAPAELKVAQGALDEAKQLRDEGRYQESIAKAAVARAELERTIKTVEEYAAQSIESARNTVEWADETKTAELQPEAYQRALQYINEAKIQLDTKRFKDAVLTAKRAEGLLRQASRDAAGIWASQEMKLAQAALAGAKQTGADIYAVQLVREADEDLTQAAAAAVSAQELLGQKRFDEARAKYVEAKNLAVQANEESVRAKYRLIDDAEAAIVEARAYDGWRYDLKGLTDAVLTLDRSREAMEQGRYMTSHDLARAADQLANKITRVAKNQSFSKRLDVVDNLIHEVLKKGGSYYQPTPVKDLAVELDKLREQYRSSQYDSSEGRVVEVEARLQGLLDSMPGLVTEWISNQRTRLSEIEQSDVPPTVEPRILDARKFLRFAEMDYERGKYRSSYANLLVGRRIIDDLARDRSEVAYQRSVRLVLDDLARAMEEFNHFLSLNPKTLWGMTRAAWGEQQFIAIAGKSTPSDFRERIDAIIVSFQAIKPAPSMMDFHQEMSEMLDTARLSAINYERLMVLSEFDATTRREIIEKAYNLMQDVKKRRANLERMLLPRSVADQKI